jgi:hypothetical protein
VDNGKNTHSTLARRGVWTLVLAALATFARRSGGSLNRHPMPELREIGHEWRRRVGA